MYLKEKKKWHLLAPHTKKYLSYHARRRLVQILHGQPYHSAVIPRDPRRSKQKSFFESLGKWNARAYRFFFLLYFTFTVKAKTTVDTDTDSPQTGDNSHMALWLAVLLVSGGTLIVTTVVSKKRKRAVR